MKGGRKIILQGNKAFRRCSRSDDTEKTSLLTFYFYLCADCDLYCSRSPSYPSPRVYAMLCVTQLSRAGFVHFPIVIFSPVLLYFLLILCIEGSEGGDLMEVY
jgi:hypothetical protein